MFERLESHAARLAEARASERKRALAEQLGALLPRSVSIAVDDDGVLISGPGLGRRLVLDSSLRWTIAGLLK